jgi:hypothetical protein
VTVRLAIEQQLALGEIAAGSLRAAPLEPVRGAEGMPKDDLWALACFRQAARQGLPEGELRMGEVLARLGHAPEGEAAIARVTRSHDLRSAQTACVRLSDLLGVQPGRHAESMAWLERGVELEHPPCMLRLGDRLLHGNGAPADRARARARGWPCARWWRVSVSRGSSGWAERKSRSRRLVTISQTSRRRARSVSSNTLESCWSVCSFPSYFAVIAPMIFWYCWRNSASFASIGIFSAR